jgi:hypothetical protein
LPDVGCCGQYRETTSSYQTGIEKARLSKGRRAF